MEDQKINRILSFGLVLATCTLICCGPGTTEKVQDQPPANVDGIMFAMLRNLDPGVVSTDEVHGYAIMDFNPFSEKFGDTIQTVTSQLGHHGYFSPVNGSLYVTMNNDLAARVNLTIEANGLPKIHGINIAP